MACTPEKKLDESTEDNKTDEEVMVSQLTYAAVELAELRRLAAKAFRYINPDGRNIETGEFYDGIMGNSFVNHIDRIKTLEIITENNTTAIFRYTYKNGLLLTEYSTTYLDPTYDYQDEQKMIEDGTYLYEYDAEERLTKCSFWTIEHPDNEDIVEGEYKRVLYYYGRKYYTEIIGLIPSGYKIVKYDYSDTKFEAHFITENGKLKEVAELFYVDGKEFNWYFYSYDENGNLEKLENALNDKENIVKTIRVVERQGNQILKMEYIFKSDERYVSEYHYSGYDGYDNWTKLEIYRDGEVDETVWRAIEYVE
jgi:hypothetical protein